VRYEDTRDEGTEIDEATRLTREVTQAQGMMKGDAEDDGCIDGGGNVDSIKRTSSEARSSTEELNRRSSTVELNRGA
jgi:hypothetical protein